MHSTKVIVILSICLSVAYSKSLYKKAEEDCPQFCPQLFQPVCASDGKENRVFSNDCELKAFNCWEAKTDFEVLSIKQCEQDPFLGTILAEEKDCGVCTYMYSPVCGVNADGQTRTFANACMLDFVNCDESSDYRMLRTGEC